MNPLEERVRVLYNVAFSTLGVLVGLSSYVLVATPGSLNPKTLAIVVLIASGIGMLRLTGRGNPNTAASPATRQPHSTPNEPSERPQPRPSTGG